MMRETLLYLLLLLLLCYSHTHSLSFFYFICGEAVVSAALFQQPNFETVKIEVPGLELEQGALSHWGHPLKLQ